MEKTIEDLEETLECLGVESSYFTEPDFVKAVVGITDDGQRICRYDAMVQSLVKRDGMTHDDAEEFIQYNTVRTIPYMPAPKPIIMYDLEVQ